MRRTRSFGTDLSGRCRTLWYGTIPKNHFFRTTRYGTVPKKAIHSGSLRKIVSSRPYGTVRAVLWDSMVRNRLKKPFRQNDTIRDHPEKPFFRDLTGPSRNRPSFG